jgi:YbgC/YbaW family acyl-CoA thioester hydrolase
MTSPRFTTTCRVEFSDTDMAGIVHFSNFFRYMEQAESEYFRSYGHTLAKRSPDGTALGWPRVSAACSFKAPAYYEDVLDIQIFILRRGVKSLTLQFEFHRGETLIATGQVKTAYCLFRPGEPIQSLPIPDAYNAMLGEEEGLASDDA